MKQKIFNLIILDASGSMETMHEQAVLGTVETIQTIRAAQRENPEQEHFFSFIVFNSDAITTIYDSVLIDEVPEFKKEDYHPDCCTPLFDAMGDGITHLRHKVCKEDNVLVTIITDGYENASREWNNKQIFDLVAKLEKKNWLFTYIGANQDAMKVGESMGIRHCMNFESSDEGASAMFATERRSRRSFYGKLSRGEAMCDIAQAEYFINDEDEPRRKEETERKAHEATQTPEEKQKSLFKRLFG